MSRQLHIGVPNSGTVSRLTHLELSVAVNASTNHRRGIRREATGPFRRRRVSVRLWRTSSCPIVDPVVWQGRWSEGEDPDRSCANGPVRAASSGATARWCVGQFGRSVLCDRYEESATTRAQKSRRLKASRFKTLYSRLQPPQPATPCFRRVDCVDRCRLPCAAKRTIPATGRSCTGRTGPVAAG